MLDNMNLGNSTYAKILIGISLILALCLAFFMRPTSGLNVGLKRLAADFRAANQAETIEPMLKLYCLEGIDELSITRLKRALQYELGLPIRKIEFEPLSGATEETIQFTHNGIQYGPTLKPRYRMRVTYEGKDRFTSLFTIGKTGSSDWQFISARPVSTTVD